MSRSPSVRRRTGLKLSAALFVLASVSHAPIMHAASAHCSEITELRNNMAKMNATMANKLTDDVVQAQPDPSNSSCISDYGPNLGLGLPGLGDLLDGIGDAACSALDSYISDSLSGIGATITGPFDLAGVDFGLGEGEGSFEVSRDDIGVDMDAVFDRIRDEAPEVDNGYRDFDRSGGRDVGDYPLLEQSRGRSVGTPGFNPSSAGRR